MEEATSHTFSSGIEMQLMHQLAADGVDSMRKSVKDCIEGGAGEATRAKPCCKLVPYIVFGGKTRHFFG